MRLRSALMSAALWSALATVCRADQLQQGPDPVMSFYAPSPADGTRFSHLQGYITSYRIGNRYGEVDVRDGDGRVWKMLTGGDLLIENRTIGCTDAPHPGDTPNDVTCSDWPDDITLGRTMVTLTYWQDELNYKPILVVSRINITRGAFLP